MKRVGPRGTGQWERVSWDDALDAIAGQDPRGADRGPAQRGDVSRRPAGRGRLHGARAPVVGHRRTQLAHQHLLFGRPDRLRLLDGYRSALAGLRQRRFILLVSAHLESGHYFNPHAQRIIEAKSEGRQDRRDRPAPVEYRLDVRLLAACAPAPKRAPPGDGQRPNPGGPVRPRVRAPLDQLGRRPATMHRNRGHLRRISSRC